MSALENDSDTEAPKSEWADIKFKVAEAEFTVNVNVGGNGGEEDGQVIGSRMGANAYLIIL